jgi:hypothetical protein
MYILLIILFSNTYSEYSSINKTYHGSHPHKAKTQPEKGSPRQRVGEDR